MRDHAVLVLNDEITVGGTVFLDLRQGLDAPPAIIFLREVLKTIPRSVGRILGLIRTYGIIQPVAVEIDAVVARMGEHAIQHHADALAARRLAQAHEILVRAEGGVHVRIVPGVVFVIGLCVENRVQIQHRYAEVL